MSAKSVLIVEDEAIVAADLSRRLERLGYAISGNASSGELAVETASQLRPDLVLMDIRLAGAMDGITAAEIIRSKMDVPVVFLTAYSDPPTLDRAKVTEPFGYVTKPFEEGELRKTIELAMYKHRAEQQVRQHREWLRVTLASICDAVITCDADARITFLNPVAESIIEWKLEDALGQDVRTVLCLTEEGAWEPCESPAVRVLQYGKRTRMGDSTVLISKSGRRIPVEDSASPIVDAAGKVTGVVIVLRDVTEKRLAQRALDAAHEQTLNILESIMDGFFSLDRDYRVTYINERGAQLLQQSRENVLHRNIWATFPEAIGSVFEESAARSMNERVLVKFEGYYSPLQAWFETHIYPAKEGISVFFQDITKRKQMGEQTRVQAAALEAAANAVTILNPDGTIEWVNSAFTKLTGYGAEEAVGQTPRVLKSGKHSPEFYKAMWETVLAGKVWRGELINRRKDGSLYAEDMTITPVTDQQGAIKHFVAIKQDVSDQKKVEDTLRFLVQVGARSGEDFFRLLARHLSESIGMDYVCIDRLQPGSLLAVTLAVYHDGRFEDNVAYTLKETPCGVAVGQAVCCFPNNVREQFPNDRVLQEIEAESYIGATLWSSQGQPIGLIALLSRKPMTDSSTARAVLQIAAVRAAAELERREAEKALEQSEARLSGIVNSAMDAIVSVDSNHRVVLFNPAAERMLQRTSAEVVGKPLEIVLPKNPLELHQVGTAEFDSKNGSRWEVGRGETVARRGNGEEFPVEASISRVKTHGETLLTAVLRDITERKEAERARDQLMSDLAKARDELEQRVQERTADLQSTMALLQTSERRYHTLFDEAPIGIAVTTRSGAILDANPRMYELLGRNVEEAKGMSSVDFYKNPEDRRKMLRGIRRTGRLRKFETALKRGNGETFPALMHVARFNLSGIPVLMTLVQDMTLNKQAEKRIHGITKILELFATRSCLRDYISEAAKLLREWCECDAAGIRLLDEQGRLPFAAAAGFRFRLLRVESKSELSSSGCACMRILRGTGLRTDHIPNARASEYFCNDLSEFANQRRTARSPGLPAPCLDAGYRSIAHVPIRVNGRFQGSIHLAHGQANRFTPEIIEFIGSVASLMGEAVHRFQVEKSLAESEERFRSLFERHDAIMLLIDPVSGEVVDANPAAAAMYGCSCEYLKTLAAGDLGFAALAGPDSKQELSWNPCGKRYETPIRLGSSVTRTVEVYASPITLLRRTLLFAIIHDVTERKLLERQIVEISEQERQRIGRDLHDSLGGHLTGLALLARALSQTLEQDNVPQAEMAAEIAQELNQGVVLTRAISHGLCPIDTGEQGIVTGLHEFAAGVRQRCGVECHFEADKDMSVEDPVMASHLFRIAEEAVNNALRHAHPKHIEMSLTRNRQGLSLIIWNDGDAPPTDLDIHRGLGLRTMRYRANLMGGEFNLKPAQNGGTLVSCVVPEGKTTRGGGKRVKAKRLASRRKGNANNQSCKGS